MADWTRLPSGLHFTTPLLIAIGAGVVAIGATIPSIAPAVRAITLSSDEIDGDDPLDVHLKQYDELAKTSVARFEGRTPFFPPPPPKAPPPPKPKPKPAPPPPPPPKPKPAPEEYDGPQPTGLFANLVFFDSTRVKVGDKYQTVEVLEATGPWNIKLRYTKAGHEPGEYVVSTWKATSGFNLDAPNPYPDSAIIKDTVEGMDEKSGAQPESATPPSPVPAPGAVAGAAKPVGPKPPPDSESPQVPAARSPEVIAAMSEEEAQSAIEEVRTAIEMPNLDDDTRARLEGEVKLLAQRISELLGEK